MRSPRHEQSTPRLYVIHRPTRTVFRGESGESHPYCHYVFQYADHSRLVMLGVWCVHIPRLVALTQCHFANFAAPISVVSPLERLEITEDGSAHVTVRTTISLAEFDEVPLLSISKSQSTPLTTMRRSLSSVRSRRLYATLPVFPSKSRADDLYCSAWRKEGRDRTADRVTYAMMSRSEHVCLVSDLLDLSVRPPLWIDLALVHLALRSHLSSAMKWMAR